MVFFAYLSIYNFFGYVYMLSLLLFVYDFLLKLKSSALALHVQTTYIVFVVEFLFIFMLL